MSVMIAVATAPAVGNASLGPSLLYLFGMIGALFYMFYVMAEYDRNQSKIRKQVERDKEFYRSKREDEEKYAKLQEMESTKAERYAIAQAKFEASLLADAEERSKFFQVRGRNEDH